MSHTHAAAHWKLSLSSVDESDYVENERKLSLYKWANFACSYRFGKLLETVRCKLPYLHLSAGGKEEKKWFQMQLGNPANTKPVKCYERTFVPVVQRFFHAEPPILTPKKLSFSTTLSV